MCGTSTCTNLLRLVDFSGAASYISVIDYLKVAGAVGGIAILDENIRSVWI